MMCVCVCASVEPSDGCGAVLSKCCSEIYCAAAVWPEGGFRESHHKSALESAHLQCGASSDSVTVSFIHTGH